MTRTHTPGPWRIGDAGNTIFGPPNGRPSPQRIADLACTDHKANGRLIAAAPEMLEALRAILRECAITHKHWGEGSNLKEANAAVDSARAAIARAEGIPA